MERHAYGRVEENRAMIHRENEAEAMAAMGWLETTGDVIRSSGQWCDAREREKESEIVRPRR